MSQIMVVIKKRGDVFKAIIHYRCILDALNRNINDIIRIKRYSNSEIEITPFDAGIIIFDFDKKTILSLQSAFGWHNIDRESRTRLISEWNFIDLGLAHNSSKAVEKLKKILEIEGIA